MHIANPRTLFPLFVGVVLLFGGIRFLQDALSSEPRARSGRRNNPGPPMQRSHQLLFAGLLIVAGIVSLVQAYYRLAAAA